MNKGQVSIDLLLALVVFLVIFGVLLNYINNFEKVSENYVKNASGFNDYIKNYDFIKSVDKANISYLIDFNHDINFVNNNIIFDENNGYIVNVINTDCNIVSKECFK
jgi:hypothetical protein